jgi:hypothetical protein
VADARRLVVEAEAWVRDAASLSRKEVPADPETLVELVLRARASGLALPALSALEERAAKVGAWVAATDGLLARARAAGAIGALQSSVPLDELLKLHAEALRLRVAGSTWAALLATLDGVARGLVAVRASLAYFSNPATVALAISGLRALGVALPVESTLREILSGLPQPAPAPAATGGAAGPHSGLGMSLGAIPFVAMPGGAPLCGGAAVGALACVHPMPHPQLVAVGVHPQYAFTVPSFGVQPHPIPMPQPMPTPMPTLTRTFAQKLTPARHAEPKPCVGLHGLPTQLVAGARVRVYYEEEGTLVGYPGVAESVDADKGI